MLAVGGLHFIGAAGELNWIDPETYQLVRSKGQIHDGHTVAAVLNEDRTRIATGSSDGFVRVWDAETGELVHEVPLNGIPVQGVAFVSEHHLAITQDNGNLLIATTDPDELLALVRASLTRGFPGPSASASTSATTARHWPNSAATKNRTSRLLAAPAQYRQSCSAREPSRRIDSQDPPQARTS